MNDNDLLRAGVIVKTHGLKGEVSVFPTTDDPERFSDLKECIVRDRSNNTLTLHPVSVKYFKQFVIIKFKEFNDINEVMPIVKQDLMVTREHAIKLEPGEYFICDLLGHKVLTYEDEEIGTLEEVLTTAANNVYVVKNNEGKNILIPVIPDSKITHDMENGITRLELLKGLL